MPFKSLKTKRKAVRLPCNEVSIMSELSRERLSNIGIVSTNVQRLDEALDKLHNAVSRMDRGNRSLFYAVPLGAAVAAAVEQYGALEDEMVRKDHFVDNRKDAEPIVYGMAKALFVSAYADALDQAEVSYQSGVQFETIAPPVPPQAYADASRLVGMLEQANAAGLYVLYHRACVADGDAEDGFGPMFKDRDRAELFGHYLAMQSVGHGVSWFDDHAKFDLAFPHYFSPDATTDAAGVMVSVLYGKKEDESCSPG